MIESLSWWDVYDPKQGSPIIRFRASMMILSSGLALNNFEILNESFLIFNVQQFPYYWIKKGNWKNRPWCSLLASCWKMERFYDHFYRLRFQQLFVNYNRSSKRSLLIWAVFFVLEKGSPWKRSRGRARDAGNDRDAPPATTAKSKWPEGRGWRRRRRRRPVTSLPNLTTAVPFARKVIFFTLRWVTYQQRPKFQSEWDNMM